MAFWPTSVATDADLYIAKNSLQTTLATALGTGDTTVVLASATGFPVAGAVVIGNEVIFYTNISGASLTGCTRGADGTTAATHSIGVPVGAAIIAFHHNGLKDEIEAIESWLDTHLGKSTNVLAAEFEFLDGVTSGIQAQLNTKATDSLVVHLAGTETVTGQKTFNDFRGTFGANIAAGGFKITGLAAGSTNGDSLRYEQVIGQFLALSGGTMSGNIAMGSNKLTGLAAGSTNGDSLRYEQLVGQYLLLSGGTMSGAIAMGTSKITGLGNGTAAQDAAAYSQVKILQVVQATSTTGFNTTSSSFVDTNLSGSITPSSSSSKVLVWVMGQCRNSGANMTYFTILRGSTNLGDSSNGFGRNGNSTSASTTMNAYPHYLDSPATTSSTTYKVQIRTDGQTGTWGIDSGVPQVMILMEVQ